MMTDSEKQKHRDTLTHALRALRDGSGHDEWGPAPIATSLFLRGERLAGVAFELACICQRYLIPGLRGRHGGSTIPLDQRQAFAAFLDRVAPVLLDAMLEGK